MHSMDVRLPEYIPENPRYDVGLLLPLLGREKKDKGNGGMFGYFKKILTVLRTKKCFGQKEQAQKPAPQELSASLEKNVALCKSILGESSDIISKQFRFGENDRFMGALLMVDGLVNRDLVDLAVLKPLLYDNNVKTIADIDSIDQCFVSCSEVDKRSTIDDCIDDLLSGNTILLIDGQTCALSLGTKQWEKRGVDEPQTEAVVHGPREGFTETLRVNTALIRRRIKTPNLRMESMNIGEQTKTDICLAYIKDIANTELIEEVKTRLNKIKTDSILDSGYVAAYIEDAPYSIFTTIGNSERPDTIASRLLEGRVAIVVDGSPFVLTAPMVFLEGFQTAEDYYIKPYFASLLRIIRLLCYFITILAPALYVALTTFHQELIPTKLLFTMSAGLQGVPFPAMVEAFIMVFMFDILKEAGVRLPKPIGSAVSIVGALVIGQSAVTAGLIGPFMIIIVAITAIANFAVPTSLESITLLRYMFLIAAGLLGGLGLITSMFFVLTYLVSLKSFGIDYLSPITPFSRQGIKDTLVRMPLWKMVKRPFTNKSGNDIRRVPMDQGGRANKKQ